MKWWTHLGYSWNVVMWILFDNKHRKHQNTKPNHRKQKFKHQFYGHFISHTPRKFCVFELFANIFVVCIYTQYMCVLNLHYWTIGNWAEFSEGYQMKFINFFLDYYSLQTLGCRERERQREKGWNATRKKEFFSLAFIKMRKSDLFTLRIKFVVILIFWKTPKSEGSEKNP